FRFCGSAIRTLYPYATLFRSEVDAFRVHAIPGIMDLMHAWHGPAWVTLSLRRRAQDARTVRLVIWKSTVPSPYWSELVLRTQVRSEEHTSELQSRENIVCRLL